MRAPLEQLIAQLKQRAEVASFRVAVGGNDVVWLNDALDWLDELAEALALVLGPPRLEEKENGNRDVSVVRSDAQGLQVQQTQVAVLGPQPEPEEELKTWRLTNPSRPGTYGTYYWVCACDSFTAIRNGHLCPKCQVLGPQPEEWRPISTAPKREWILVTGDDYAEVCPMLVAMQVEPCAAIPYGWIGSNHEELTPYSNELPTHWQPLPAALGHAGSVPPDKVEET